MRAINCCSTDCNQQNNPEPDIVDARAHVPVDSASNGVRLQPQIRSPSLSPTLVLGTIHTHVSIGGSAPAFSATPAVLAHDLSVNVDEQDIAHPTQPTGLTSNLTIPTGNPQPTPRFDYGTWRDHPMDLDFDDNASELSAAESNHPLESEDEAGPELQSQARSKKGRGRVGGNGKDSVCMVFFKLKPRH
jgi:hypothetical protein